MVQNRPLRMDGGNSGFGARKFTFEKAVRLVMRDRVMSRFTDQIVNTFRKIVREEVDRLLQPFISSLEGFVLWIFRGIRRSLPSSTPIERSRFELRFINSPPPTIYTVARIKAEDGSQIKIELVDTVTNSRVVTGPLSSLRRLEIVALDGDFTAEIWDFDEFERNILRERKGKQPLVAGELAVTLKDGVGVIGGDVLFTDNSSWTRSRKFRLGVRSVRRDVKAARSEPFVCKDKRGEYLIVWIEAYEKHHPPLPGDEVWRLEKISKVGDPSKRLAEKGIRTVKDFLRGLATDPDSLRLMVGEETSNRKWEAIVAHASCCVLDETEFYTYRSLSRGGAILLLNFVYNVVKVSFHGCPFRNVDHLSLSEKLFLDELKREAYQNTDSFEQYVGVPGSHHVDFQRNLLHLDDQFSHFVSSDLRNSFRPDMMAPHDSQAAVTIGGVENTDQTHVTNMTTWSPGSTWCAQQQYDGLYVPRAEGLGLSDSDMCVRRIIKSPRVQWFKIRAAIKLREVYTVARNRRRAYSYWPY